MVIGREVIQECFISSILFNVYGKYLMKEALTAAGYFKLGGVS